MQAYAYGMAPAGYASAAHPVGAAIATPMVYDPMAPIPIDKMNAFYMHRHIPVMTGGFLRVPGRM